MDDKTRNALYERVTKEILPVVEGETNLTARMASVACLLAEAFDYYYWTGFYVVDPEKPGELVVGPYQGTLGCLRITFGKGVCGVAAKEKKTQVVDDVNAFPGHIACDVKSRSEIVVPVFDKAGALIAVLDIDSEAPGSFGETDKKYLEALVREVFAK